MKSKTVSPSAAVAVVVDGDPMQLIMLAGFLTKAGLNNGFINVYSEPEYETI